jgi:hypothetical protein
MAAYTGLMEIQLGAIVLHFGYLALALGYLVPFAIAQLRAKRQTTAILVVNGLLGWTLVGWVVALVWALMPDPNDSNEQG